MKSMFTHYLFKNKINVFGLILIPFMMAFSTTDPAFLFFITWLMPDQYNINQEEFTLSLPVSFNDRAKGHLLYVFVSILFVLIPFLSLSFFRPYAVQTMVMGITAIITSIFFRTRKFYQTNLFVQIISWILQFAVFYLIVERDFYPLFSAFYSILLTLIIYLINYTYAYKNERKNFYVKSK